MNMQRKIIAVWVAAVLGLVWVAGSYAQPDKGQDQPAEKPSVMTKSKKCKKCLAKTWKGLSKAVAVVHPTEGNSASGTVRFTRTDDGIKITIDMQGLSSNATHAIHVHEFGDATAPDGTSTGGHYNPQNHPHGLPDAVQRHAGDLGNLEADADGHAHKEIIVDNLTIAGYKNPVLGRGIIVHAKADDGGQPTGNAGGRIGCGVIGVAKPSNE